jgi:hypothetical protein
MGLGGQCHTPAALLLGKTQYSLYRRMGEPWGQSVWVWEVSLYYADTGYVKIIPVYILIANYSKCSHSFCCFAW